MTDETPPKAIERSFRELSNDEVADIEKASAVLRAGYLGTFGWKELLTSDRVLIVSEAGAGKTHECKAQRDSLWAAGEPAFYLDLSTLAISSVREMLSAEEEKRFVEWLRSQSEVATFFLDSIDELKLSQGNFDQALTRFGKAVSGQLGRVRVIITTRPVPVDQAAIRRHLPIPSAAETKATAEVFADIVMEQPRKKAAEDTKTKRWRNVGLMPLSREQMREFALIQGVTDPNALLEDIRVRDAEEFAERPQDLIEICSDWREHHRIRSHSEQVKTNVETKLRPRPERKEAAELPQEKALEGASRLALAAMLTRKLTLRHSAESDAVQASEAALDVRKILRNFSDKERNTLLERPLFGFATYGRVRFHHRSVVEYLAARRLEDLLARGVPISAIKRLLFVDTAQGTRTVRPTMRPVAAWLALWRNTVFDDIVAADPAIVLDYGDPRSLAPAQRINALEAYVARYGKGGWRGRSTPRVQVHRFASRELGQTIVRLWHEGIENPEVRDLLLEIVGAGKLTECADIPYNAAVDVMKPVRERIVALRALIELKDRRVSAISASVESDPATWPAPLTRHALLYLFPNHIAVARVSKILTRAMENPRSVGELGFRFPREIESADVDPGYLDDLREALTKLILDSASWESDKFPNLRTKRPDLIAALLATCRRQCAESVRSDAWIRSSLLAIRLLKESHSEREALAELRGALAELPPEKRDKAFWDEDAFLQSLHASKDIWHRVFNLAHYGGLQLGQRDEPWILKRLSDPSEPLDRREMMLWIEITSLLRREPGTDVSLDRLGPYVADAPSLTATLEGRMAPPKEDEDLQRLLKQNEELAEKEKRRTARAHKSWVKFWREVAENPDAVFAPDRADNTAWNLWQAMARSGEESRASGWNRRFIEEQFGREVADRLRTTLSGRWRKDKPTLRSERLEAERNTFLVRWQLGLAAIAAEAEDPNWAKALTEEEAELACRYAPLELNGFPSWLESLVEAHPKAVDRVLGQELSLSLSESGAENFSFFLQNVSHATPSVAALFIPRVREWLIEMAAADAKSNDHGAERKLGQAIEILMKSGSAEDRRFLEATARQRLANGLGLPFADVWLPVLLQLDPAAEIDVLEKGLAGSSISQEGAGVQWFAKLFGRDHGVIGVDLTAPAFTAQLLLRLIRVSYAHVRVKDDMHHEGSYSPDTRDHAERARNAVLSALLATKGAEGWAAKIAMANDPLFEHFKDRAIALAQEKAAEEADSVALTEAKYVALDKYGESPPSTRDAMFALMGDRLDDIDDLLLQDDSPREAWAGISKETTMRKAVAHELRLAANHAYTIDQEGATADDKETDIRFRVPSGPQGTIELKIGDKDRSAAELRDAIKTQLLTKYMAADECRAGCLLVTLAKNKTWTHPDTGESLDFDDLIAMLNEEARRIMDDMGGAVRLMAKGLDLRPRLKTEKALKSSGRKKPIPRPKKAKRAARATRKPLKARSRNKV